MKKIISQVMVFAIVFVLIQNGGPGSSSESVYYAGGKNNTTTNVANAQMYQTVGEAYAKQIDLGADWRIESR